MTLDVVGPDRFDAIFLGRGINVSNGINDLNK